MYALLSFSGREPDGDEEVRAVPVLPRQRGEYGAQGTKDMKLQASTHELFNKAFFSTIVYLNGAGLILTPKNYYEVEESVLAVESLARI